MVILLAALGPAAARLTLTGAGAPIAAGGPPTPVMLQHVASSTNPAGVGVTGNAFKIVFPNPPQSNDTLVCGVSYPHGHAPTITDTLGLSWTSQVTEDAGTNNYVARIYTANVGANSSAANEIATATLSSSGSKYLPFQFDCSEFSNIATASPANGTIGGNSIAPAATTYLVDPGAFTPGNNNANGGNLVWAYAGLWSSSQGSNPTAWAPASGYTLLDGDITDIGTGSGFGRASQYYVQTTAASTDPTFTATGDTNNEYNVAAIALKVAAAGGALPGTIYIRSVQHETFTNAGGAGSVKFEFPTFGNLRVLTAPANASDGYLPVSSVTDSEGNTWTQIAASSGYSAQIWYWAGAAANHALTVTVNILSGYNGDPDSLRFFDIENATASPLDTSSYTTADVACAGTSITDVPPAITPAESGTLVIAVMGIEYVYVTGLNSGSPAGALFVLTTYTGETSADLMENADGTAILYNAPNGTAENWDWNISAAHSGNVCFGVAAAFK